MAVYQKLLLSTGGGIISNKQQADQVQNTATLLIGLGGTGVHCIRTIKTQVYDRLKPDNPEDIVPQYSHIRFLGVDTDRMSFSNRLGGGSAADDIHETRNTGILSLTGSEYFSIENPNIPGTLSNTLALKQRHEFDWLEYENIDVPNLGTAGAGGIRQIGRFMMMDKSTQFLNRVVNELNAAKSGLASPTVNVHIFTGLSGGTGAGCFLDVCYMVRSIVKVMGGANVYGYFFLPDVNLANIPMDNTHVRTYIPRNGYAAMQELEYCMGLPRNGGSFEQTYQGNKIIRWDAPPVDMAHLICATDQNNNVIPHAYEHAMSVTAEYIMDFLTHDTGNFGLSQHLANFRAMVGVANSTKTIGSRTDYCVIGAACASIPLREINTFLAAELFDKFSSIGGNVPDENAVNGLAVVALAPGAQSLRDVYETLLQAVSLGADANYEPYTADWKYVHEYGNADMVAHYTNQTAAKKNVHTQNASALATPGNAESLMGRLNAALKPIMCDLSRGPIYAHRLLSAAEKKSFINIIDGLIAENEARYSQEAAQAKQRIDDYEGARYDFENNVKKALFDTHAKQFQRYEYYLLLHQQHTLAMADYELMRDLLNAFRQQVMDADAGYYVRLARVVENLMETFRDNRNAVIAAVNTNGKIASNDPTAAYSFSVPMVTIRELMPRILAEVNAKNIPGLLEQFMTELINHQDEWINQDENRITRLVTDFFINTAFGNFAGHTITEFLRDKYQARVGGTVNDEMLKTFVLEDWIKPLTERASPLFFFNNAIWNQAKSSTLAFLSYPTSSAPISNAATEMNSIDPLWNLKASALTDRIFVMCSACGLPLSSYNNCSAYERIYYNDKSVGRHYYEGKPIPGQPFSDWNKLPSVTPQSVIDAGQAPLGLASALKPVRELFDRAVAVGAFNFDDGVFYQVSASDAAKGNAVREKANALLAAASKPEDVPGLEAAARELRDTSSLRLVSTGLSLPNDGARISAEAITSLYKDYFVYFPAIHEQVRQYVEGVESFHSDSDKLIAALEEKISDIQRLGSAMNDYCDAIFTGVISVEGKSVVYHQSEFGISSDVVLSRVDDAFPFGKLPFYQGFVSFSKLDAGTQAKVRREFQSLVNADSPQIAAAGSKIKEMLTDNRISAMVQLAAAYTNKAEIVDFLRKLKEQFHIFCLSNGIEE